MEESRSVPQTVQSSLETPNRVIVPVETFRRLHVHQIAPRHARVHECNTKVTEQNGEVFRHGHRQQHSRGLEPSLRPENLRTVSPRNALSLVLVPFSCNTIVWTRLCRSAQLSELPDTRENFYQVEFTIHTSYHFIKEKFFQRVFLKVEAICHE